MPGSISLQGMSGDIQAAAGDATRWTQWAAGMWAGLTFLEDAGTPAPPTSKPSLAQPANTLTTLCNALENVDPQIAEIGTRGVRAGRVG